MNAAFLLVTTAWLAGADAPPPAAAPVPAAPAASYSNCGGCNNNYGGGCCDSCNDCCGGHRFFSKLRGLFHRDDCCESSCDSCGGCGHSWSGWGSGHRSGGLFHRDCGCDTGCNTGCNTCNECDSCGGHRFLDKIRGWFHHDCGCDSGCGGCDSCGSTSGGMMAPRAEPIPPPKGAEPPKKMPEPPAKKVQAFPPQNSGTPGNSLLIEQ